MYMFLTAQLTYCFLKPPLHSLSFIDIIYFKDRTDSLIIISHF